MLLSEIENRQDIPENESSVDDRNSTRLGLNLARGSVHSDR